MKKAVDIPVMAVGLITEPEQAETILTEGRADAIAMARAFLWDPRWPWRAAVALGAKVDGPRQYWRSAPHGVEPPFTVFVAVVLVASDPDTSRLRSSSAVKSR